MRKEGTTTPTTTAALSILKLPAHTRGLRPTPPLLLKHLVGKMTEVHDVDKKKSVNSSVWCDYQTVYACSSIVTTGKFV